MKWQSFIHTQRLRKVLYAQRLRALQQLAKWGVREQTLLVMLAFLIGLATGAATWVFKECVEFFHRYLFVPLAAKSGATSHWQSYVFLPLAPMAGGLLLVLWRKLWSRDKSPVHGLAGVLLSLTRESGQLHPSLGAETIIASSLTIGSGGSAGPEAPIAIIGSSIGSLVGNSVGISRRNLPVLIGCGAAGGISAVFGAPIAGVLFAVEVMLRDFSIRTLTPVVISSVISTTMYNAIVGSTQTSGLFQMPLNTSNLVFNFPELPWYLFLGVVCGMLAVVFTQAMTWVEDIAQRRNARIRTFFYPMLGAGLAGVCGIVVLALFRDNPFMAHRFAQGYVPIFSDGYPTIRRAIDSNWYNGLHHFNGHSVRIGLEFLLVICLLKIAATSLTLGSGGSGGIIAPALFIGAAGGGALGIVLHAYNPQIEPATYALVGMGSVLAATIQAPLTAIILLFELTRNYAVMLPIMLSAVTATVIQQVFIGESLYTLPLKKLGVKLGSAVGLSALQRISLDQIPLITSTMARPDEPLSVILQRSAEASVSDFVVEDHKGNYLGMLTLDDLKPIMLEPEAAPLLLVGEVLRTDVPPLKITDTIATAVEAFSRHDISHLAVLAAPQTGGAPPAILGLLSRSDLMRRYYQEISTT